jgi:hypothetical protein
MKSGEIMTDYKYNIDVITTELNQKGYAFLPTIKPVLEANLIYEKYLEENNLGTYTEASDTHKLLIELLDLQKLFIALHTLAEQTCGKNIDPMDQYLISRYVKANQSSEGYRGHFDSHFITIVLPIQIPPSLAPKRSGQLIALPKARMIPRNELQNIYGKIAWKRHNSEKGYDRLVLKQNALEIDFSDYRPLIFIGNSTFHGNRPLSGADQPRLSMLCHLFDTSPKIGIGSLLRLIRNR